MGWGIAETAVMMTTVAIYAYANDSFPRNQVSLYQNTTISAASDIHVLQG